MFTAGLRANQYYLHSSFDNQNLFYELPFNSITLKNRSFNGNIGFSSFAKGWKLNTNLSTGFRSPNLDDIGKILDFQEAQIIVPNKQLKSELAYTIDCSIAKSVKNYGRISMSTYFTFLDDAMVRKKNSS